MREGFEGNDFYPYEVLEECLHSPDTLDELTPAQVAVILELAKAKIFEINDPVIKARYQRLIDWKAAAKTS